MAKGQVVAKTRRTRNGMVTNIKVGKSITKRDHQEAKSARKHELEMEKVRNTAYQKEISKRTSGLSAAAAIAAPATTAVANTNAFASGGFELGNSQTGEEEESAASSGSSNSNNKEVWG